MSTTRGVLHVHSAPAALCPHIEWAVGGVFGIPVRLEWTPQPAERAGYRAEHAWSGRVGSAAALASALQGWRRLRFEVTEDATPGSEGERFSHTPTLGTFRATVGPHGDVMVHEDRIRHAIRAAQLGGRDLAASLQALLGAPWDAELEPFRHAGEGAPVRWLHKVV